MQSAAEREIARFIAYMRFDFRAHDRAVLAGLALSVIPVPPANFLGLLLLLLNLALLLTGRLPRREVPLLILSCIALVLYALLWSSILHFAAVHSESIFVVPKLLHDWFFNLLAPASGGMPAQNV